MQKDFEKLTNRYSIETQSIDIATTYLALDAIAKYPQIRHGATYLIAEHLLKSINKKGQLSLVQADQAKIDPTISWEFTKIIHKIYAVGTDRTQYRNPEKPDSPQIHPVDPQWLADFVKQFIFDAIDAIRDKVKSYIYQQQISNENKGKKALTPDQISASVNTAEKLQRIIQNDPVLLKHLISHINSLTSPVKADAKDRREKLKQEAEAKYGPGGVKYD